MSEDTNDVFNLSEYGFSNYQDLIKSVKNIGADLVISIEKILQYNNDLTRFKDVDELFKNDFLPNENLGEVLYYLKTFSHTLQVMIDAMVG